MNIKKILYAILLALVSTISYSQSKHEYSPLYFSGDVIVGEEITLFYNNNKTTLKNDSLIEGIVYFWGNYKWTAHDMNMVKADSLWKATISIPENISLLSFKFYAGDKIDVGNIYGHLTKNKEGRNLPSSYAGWGLLRGENSQQYGIPELIKDSTLFIKDEVLLYWFNQEISSNPAERKNIFKYALETQRRLNPEKAIEQTKREVDFILKTKQSEEVSEETYIDCIKVLKDIKEDSLANEIESSILEEFPNGILARDKEIWKLFREENSAKKESDFALFLERFPTSKFKDINTEISDLWYAKIFQSVVYNQIITKDNYGLLYKYISEVPYSYLSVFFWHIVQIPYRNNERTAAQLLPYADLIMNEIGSRSQTVSQSVYSPKEWSRMQTEKNKDALMAYARILDEMGNTPKAMALLDSINPYYKNKSADFNTVYIQTLIKSNRENEVMAIINNGIKENAASPEMLDLLKQHYVKVKGSEKGFDDYVNHIKSDDLVAAQQKKLRESMVNLPIKLFEVERLSGEKVDMAKLSGKIIVIDFWATWCVPCIAAMPGMQMAVNKYKQDNDVVFFFLSTQETKADYKERIKALIESKGYTFDIVLDQPDETSKTASLLYNTYAKEFSFSGIPQKMIIDGKGRLRWRSTGYMGSPSELADEISFIVDLLKNEDK